ncbi:hypothetical protein PPTG_04710 [Phytophthora nicotianae INRA-310]|uniref:Uncharacterized protein n=2 Tax=Phytophthora nicotianae (strain INRA-310) TaxID=761204 RepID=W2R3W5_PHYN3|nr:hypothetical protein PPTG_04710 [Phytophthora nicotianae INRA-310]ETN19374.1 hypothetical protein PPTG_04710 [Phytophthora nicotianae INRA-310]
MWTRFDAPAKSFHVDFLAEAIYKPRDAFVYAASLNQVEVVRRWITKKLNINELDKEGSHALYMAAQNESLEVLELLLESGANVDQQQRDVRSSHCAYVNVSSNLLRDDSLFDRQGKTALHSACTWGRFEAARLLLAHQASLSLRDDDGQTSLHCACRNGHVGLVQLLLNSRVDPFVADDFGATPIDVARDWQRLDILDMLAAYRATEFLEANQQRVKLLTERLSNQVELPQGVRDIIIDFLC